MISVIIPTLNAERHLVRALAPLIHGVAKGAVKEAIVADGGSDDATIEIAEAAGCEIVHAPKGRAAQLDAGAKVARSEWLLFLYADTVLSPGWLEEAERFMSRPGARARAAVFRFAFDDDAPDAARAMFWARVRSDVFKLPYGDQGLLISRQFYDALGGFRATASMEDVDLVRRIGGRRLTMLKTEAVISAERERPKTWRLLRYVLSAASRELAKSD